MGFSSVDRLFFFNNGVITGQSVRVPGPQEANPSRIQSNGSKSNAVSVLAILFSRFVPCTDRGSIVPLRVHRNNQRPPTFIASLYISSSNCIILFLLEDLLTAIRSRVLVCFPSGEILNT